VTVLKITPEHTKKTFEFKEISFVGITTDSINVLLNGQYIREMDIQSNCSFKVGEGSETKSYKKEWSHTPSPKESLWTVKAIPLPLPDRDMRFENPHIQTLRLSIELEKLKKQDDSDRATAQSHRITNLKEELNIVKTYTERERIQTELSKSRQDSINPKLHDYAIRQLEQQIKEIQIQDKIQSIKDSITYLEKLKLIEKPYFTGRIKTILIRH
jgi:hypothetical protein